MNTQLVNDFWELHYNIRNQTSTLKREQVFAFFNKTHPELENHPCFLPYTGNIRILKKTISRTLQKDRLYYATPKSQEAIRHHTTSPINIDLLVANINRLVSKSKGNKCEFLKQSIPTSNAHRIIALTETWLSPDHYTAEFIKPLHRYTAFRTDRDTNFNPGADGQLTSRGGSIIITSPDITAIPLASYSNGNCELIAIECPELSLLIANIYRPPGINSSLQKFTDILNKLDDLLHKNAEKENPMDIILSGDFNFPNDTVEWFTSEDGLLPLQNSGTNDTKAAFNALLDSATLFNLEQIVDKHTRNTIDENGNITGGSILDLVFTNIPESFSTCSIIPLNKISDHDMVHFEIKNRGNNETINDSSISEKPEIAKYNFNRINEATFAQALESTNWDDFLGGPEAIEKANENFVKALIQAADTARIKKYQTPLGNSTSSREEITNAQMKASLITQYNHPNIRHSDKIRISNDLGALNSRLISQKQGKQKSTEKKLAESINTDPKSFWKYASSKRKEQLKIGPLKIPGSNAFESDPLKMAEILSNQFKSVFTTPSSIPPVISMTMKRCPPLNDIDITHEKIIDAAKLMSISSAAGPDGVPSIIYHNFAEQIAAPTMKIWRMSLDTGKQPEGKAQAIIAPQLKPGGLSSNPEDQRPIALTTHQSKHFERIVRKEITTHMEKHNLHNPTQFGFRTGRSTVSQLLAAHDDILFNLEHGRGVDVVYLDFAKAFDKVDHNILLEKLKRINIGGKLHRWIESFLKSRQQRVRVGTALSKPVDVISGVPQGSVLGPLLFVIMMLDIIDSSQGTKTSCYADDTRMMKGIAIAYDEVHLQAQLIAIYNWATENKMFFNEKKFECLSISIAARNPQYTTPNGSIIKNKPSVKDLGIVFQDDLTFNIHITTTAAKGNRLAGWVDRSFKYKTTPLLLTLLKQLVVPQAEYGCVIWHPRSQPQIKAIESIQRRFTKKFPCFWQYNGSTQRYECLISYKERLRVLKIFSLERRRERYLIILLYKVAIKLITNPGLIIEVGQRGSWFFPCKFTTDNTIPAWIKNARNNGFHSTGPRLFNSLPRYLRTSVPSPNPLDPRSGKKMVNAFKAKLDKFLANIEDNPGTTSNSLLQRLRFDQQ